MQVTWEQDDVKAGMLVRTGKSTEDVAMIGWMEVRSDERYGLISLLDGMFTPAGGSLDAVVGYLNKYKYVPVFRNVTANDLVLKGLK